jgi:asparagine synthetase B (glutamine-hydrolysing)
MIDAACWRRVGEELRFAPDPSLLARLDPPADLDWNVLRRLLVFDFPDGPETPFIGVHRPEAGRARTLEPEPAPDAPEPDLWQALVVQCVTLMKQGHRAAVMLSGGLDSSAIAAAAAQAAQQLDQPPPLLLSATYPGLDCDESSAQEAVARHLSLPRETVDATRIPLFPGVQDAIRDSLHPLVDGQEAINLELYRRAREAGCDVVLTGVGGDELFEGRGAEIDLVRSGRWRTAWRLIRSTERARPQSLAGSLWRRGIRLPISPAGEGRTARDRLEAGSWCRAVVRRTLANPGLSWRMEMARRTARRADLRFECPFLGDGFLESYQRVPVARLIGDGTVKALLRRIAAPALPESVVRRVVKARFTAYYNARLPFDGPLMNARYHELRKSRTIDWLPSGLEGLLRAPVTSARFLTGWMAFSILEFADAWSAQSRRKPDGISE